MAIFNRKAVTEDCYGGRGGFSLCRRKLLFYVGAADDKFVIGGVRERNANVVVEGLLVEDDRSFCTSLVKT